MHKSKQIAIIDQNLAEASLGIMSFASWHRYLIFAHDGDHATTIKTRLLNDFGISLSEDYLTKQLGARFGITVLSFSHLDFEKIKASSDVVEVSSLEEAGLTVPQKRR
jgi:hypothetical protein